MSYKGPNIRHFCRRVSLLLTRRVGNDSIKLSSIWVSHSLQTCRLMKRICNDAMGNWCFMTTPDWRPTSAQK